MTSIFWECSKNLTIWTNTNKKPSQWKLKKSPRNIKGEKLRHLITIPMKMKFPVLMKILILSLEIRTMKKQSRQCHTTEHSLLMDQ